MAQGPQRAHHAGDQKAKISGHILGASLKESPAKAGGVCGALRTLGGQRSNSERFSRQHFRAIAKHFELSLARGDSVTQKATLQSRNRLRAIYHCPWDFESVRAVRESLGLLARYDQEEKGV